MAAHVLFLGPRHEHPKRMRIALWVIVGLASLQFLAAGGVKLAGQPETIENFERWGYPDWFRLVVGAGEVIGAILLVIPQTRFWAALALVIEMLGAIATHLRIAEYVMLAAPLMPLVLCALIAWLDRPEKLRRP